MYFLCYICNGEVVRRNVNTLCCYSLYYKEGQKSNSPCYEDLVFNVGVSEVITACILKQYIGTKALLALSGWCSLLGHAYVPAGRRAPLLSAVRSQP